MVSRGREPRSQFFFFNDTATTEIYTLSLHDALPIYGAPVRLPEEDLLEKAGAEPPPLAPPIGRLRVERAIAPPLDRKSTRLNSSHANISYAVFCLKKKNKRCAHPSE